MRRISKYLGWILVVIGIAAYLTDGTKGSEIPLLTGLFIVFVSREQTEDERVRSIKSSSGYVALIIAYAFKLITSNLYEHELLRFQLVEINHFLILVFALAICIFYLRLFFSLE